MPVSRKKAAAKPKAKAKAAATAKPRVVRLLREISQRDYVYIYDPKRRNKNMFGDYRPNGLFLQTACYTEFLRMTRFKLEVGQPKDVLITIKEIA